ncbi:MAG: Bcr/CflA family efflux MFS transporter [Firmicutes bacterium]|nr:Bcr/CflA family efflux MFS transporter [Bacillota bacterium]MCM1400453.1 Bcr/CflA family efflux MFS transporter [Bacteroides sp.]MCM1476907.1 Bcr/CflA family efflux MFS transporter [Bacteroides sp.]
MNQPSTRNGIVVNYVFIIAYLVGLSAFGSFVNDMYLPSLPSMTKFFHCSVPTVQLGLTMGMVGLGAGQMLLGPISDKYGRKPVLIWSTLLFIIAAVASVFSPTIHAFLGFRLVQGLGASGCYFLARTIPADLYAGRALAQTMAIVGAINGIAPASAPVIGGFLSQHWGWKSVFVVLAVLGVVLLAFSPKLKETLSASERQSGSVWDAFKRYGKLVRNYRFMVHVGLKGAALGILFAYISSAPFIMQTHFGFRQDAFGCIMGGNALMIAVGSMAALKFKLLKKAAFIGGVLVLIAVACESAVLLFCDSFILYELLLLPMLFCLGMVFTAGNTLAMNEGRDSAGDASALLGLGGYIFGAVVSPLVGMGSIMHTTAWVLLALAVIVTLFAVLSKRIPADLNQ